MKIQVAILSSSVGLLEQDINKFLLDLDPDMLVDIKYIPVSECTWPQAMIIFKIKRE